MSFKIIRKNINYMLAGYRFRIIFMFSIFFNLYAVGYLAHNQHYINGFFTVLTNSYYIIGFMAIILINTINTFNMFEQNIFYIIRFKDRKDYLIQLLKNILVSNCVLFAINIIVLIIQLNLFVGSNFILENFEKYAMLNIFYLIFYLIRMFILMQMVAIINTLLLKLIDSKIVISLNVVLWSTLLLYPYQSNFKVNSILDMFWHLCEYFRLHHYNGFSMEVLCSTIYITILLIMIFVLFNFSKNNIKKIGV